MKLKQIQILEKDENETRAHNFIASTFCLHFIPSLTNAIELANTRKLNFHIADIEKTRFYSYGKTINNISELHFSFPDSIINNRTDYLIRITQIIERGFSELTKFEKFDLACIIETLEKIKSNDFIFTFQGKFKSNRKKTKANSTLKLDLIENKLTLLHEFILPNGESKQTQIFDANRDDVYSNFLFSSSKWINSNEYCTYSRSKEILFITNIETYQSRIEFNATINPIEKLEKELLLTGFGNRIVGDWQEEQRMEVDRINFNNYQSVTYLSSENE